MSSSTNKIKIVVPIGCRSDEVLSAPVIRLLREVGEFDIHTVHLLESNFSNTYMYMESVLGNNTPDLVLLFGDRVEMCAAAAACFNNNIKTAHMYAGVTNTVATLDDINRHAISMWSQIQLCESRETLNVVNRMHASVGLKGNAYCVGITHFDDFTMRKDKLFKSFFTLFDLVLYNPITIGKCTEEMDTDITAIIEALEHDVVLINPNPDPGSDRIFEALQARITKHTKNKNTSLKTFNNVPHHDFLVLLNMCSTFISNSSSIIYEAPVLLKPDQIVHIGMRNRGRSTGPFETGASAKIVAILKSEFNVGG